MKAFLEWFQLGDLLPLAAFIFLLVFTGRQVAPPQGTVDRPAKCVFVTMAILYFVMGTSEWGMDSAGLALSTLVRGILAGGVFYGISLIALPLGMFLKAHLTVKSRPIPPTVECVIVAPIPMPPLPPPEPTVEQKAEAARIRYEKRIELIERAKLDTIEAASAKMKAKQTYLQELDKGVL